MTVPFAMLSSYSTPFEFQHAFKLASPTRLFVTPTLHSLALTSGLSEDRIYIIEGNIQGHTSYGDLVARARDNKLPRLPIQQAQKDTLAYLTFSSGTSGLPKGTLTPAHLSVPLPVLTHIVDLPAVMISHGNLIDSFFQISVVTAEAVKAQGVRISFLPNMIVSHVSCRRLEYGMAQEA